MYNEKKFICHGMGKWEDILFKDNNQCLYSRQFLHGCRISRCMNRINYIPNKM